MRSLESGRIGDLCRRGWVDPTGALDDATRAWEEESFDRRYEDGGSNLLCNSGLMVLLPVSHQTTELSTGGGVAQLGGPDELPAADDMPTA